MYFLIMLGILIASSITVYFFLMVKEREQTLKILKECKINKKEKTGDIVNVYAEYTKDKYGRLFTLFLRLLFLFGAPGIILYIKTRRLIFKLTH